MVAHLVQILIAFVIIQLVYGSERFIVRKEAEVATLWTCIDDGE